MYKPYIHWNYFILLTHKRKKTTPKHSLESGPYTLDLFIQTLHCRELIGRISILLSWLSVIFILACWNAFLDIRDAPWWYRIDVSSLWQTIFSTSIMDNYKRFALSEKIQTKCYINIISSSLLIFNQNFIFSRNLFVTIYNPEISKSTINWSILGSLRR